MPQYKLPFSIHLERKYNDINIEDFIKNTLNKNTSYSYAIHNPVASDGLPNPHCHLMLYEKNFPRNFYNEELSKEINKNILQQMIIKKSLKRYILL